MSAAPAMALPHALVDHAAIESAQAIRYEKACLNLVYYQPFFGTLVMHLKPIVSWSTQTMATDGRAIYWNPGFVAGLSNAELEGVLAHEGLHCALLHFARMGERDPLRWNFATDFEINDGLLAAGFKLPGIAVRLDSPKGDRGHLYDPKYHGMVAEFIYPLMPVPPDDPGEGDEFGDEPGEGGSSGEGEGGSPGKPGKGAGKPSQGDEGEGDADEGETGKGAGKPIGGRAGELAESTIGDVMPGEMSPAEIADAAVQWEIRTRQAIAQADRQAGFVPGSAREMIAKLNNPQLDWKERLRAFVGEACAIDVSWNRPSRRHADMIIPSRPHDAVSRILVMIDTSGSISSAELQAFLSECQGMLDEGGVQRIQWACVDTRVASHGEIVQGETFAGFTVSGRGGTHFESAMAWAGEQDDVAAIVFLTDGATASWGDDPGKPTLWIGAESNRQYLDRAPYGEIAYIRL